MLKNMTISPVFIEIDTLNIFDKLNAYNLTSNTIEIMITPLEIWCNETTQNCRMTCENDEVNGYN